MLDTQAPSVEILSPLVEGSYYADADTLSKLERDNRILFKYCSENGDVNEESNPNGSMHNIAGITNARGNVLGMMPHPERCCEALMGGEDGKYIFESLLRYALAHNDIGT